METGTVHNILLCFSYLWIEYSLKECIKRMYQNNPILDMLHMLDDLGADYQAGDSRSIIH